LFDEFLQAKSHFLHLSKLMWRASQVAIVLRLAKKDIVLWGLKEPSKKLSSWLIT
jgi:hypothetical protein